MTIAVNRNYQTNETKKISPNPHPESLSINLHMQKDLIVESNLA